MLVGRSPTPQRLCLLLRHKVSCPGTVLQEIEVGACICTPPTVSRTPVLGPFDRVKHSDICVRPDRSWNAPQTSVRPAWPRLHYTEYPRPAAALTISPIRNATIKQSNGRRSDQEHDGT